MLWFLWYLMWGAFAYIGASVEVLFVCVFFAAVPRILYVWGIDAAYKPFIRRLKCRWTIEKMQDLEKLHGLDIEQELAKVMAEEIKRETRRVS